MKRLLLILLLAFPVLAADFEVGVRHLVVFPRGDSGALDIPMGRGFSATAEVFWSERFSTQVAASFANPEAILRPENTEPVDLGTLGLDIYSVSARYHFSPQSKLSAYAGGGAALVIIGNLDDQFGDEFEATFDNETTFLGEAGLRYKFWPGVFLELGVAYMPLSASSEEIEGVNVDPLIVTGGAMYRF
jgi:outer membrane protein W